MLGAQHARGEIVRGVGGPHRHGGLRDDRARVHRRAHEVHRAAVDADAGGQRPSVRVEPLEGRQQRRVDVDQAVAPALDEGAGIFETGSVVAANANIFETLTRTLRSV